MVAKGQRVSVWGGENGLKLTMVMVEHICEFAKKHWIVHFKWIYRIVCELYLNKAIFKRNKTTLHCGAIRKTKESKK